MACAATTDKTMSERLRHEIMDHLAEAAADAAGSHASPAHFAIERFGSIEEIARDYHAVIVETRSKSLRWTVITAILVVFAVMRLRGVILEPGWRDDLVSTIWGTIVMAIDRYAFAVALFIVLWGLVTDRLRLPRLDRTRWIRQLAPRTLVMTVLPAVLILLSALAGITSLVSLTPTGRAAGLESLTLAALSTISIFISVGLVKLIAAHLRAHDLGALASDELDRGAAS